MSAPRLRLAAALAGAAALWALYLGLSFAGFFGDSIWYLEPARAFARGDGLATRLLWAAQLADFPEPRLPVRPLFHGPLALWLLGWAYRLFGLWDWVPLAASAALTIAAGAVAYRVGRDAGGERVGLLGFGLYATSVLALERNSTSLTDPLFTFLITAAFAALWRGARDGARAAPWCFAAGLLLGLASCTRLAGQAYWLGFLAATLWLHRAWRPAAALLGGLAIPLAGLAAYNYAAAGRLFYSPGFYLLYWSRSFPGGRAVTSFMGLSTLEALLQFPADVLQKAATGPFYAAGRLLEAARGPYAPALALLAFFLGWKGQPALARLRTAALCLLLPVLAVNAVVSYGAVEYLQPLYPLLMVLAAAAFWRLADENGPALGRGRYAAAAACAFLFLSPLALALKDGWKRRPERAAQREAHRAFGGFVAAHTAPGEVIYTDDPTALAWYADRPAISLTATWADAEKAFARLAPDALVVSTLRARTGDYDDAFVRALDGAGVPGFEPCARFSHGSLSAVMLRRAGACARR